MFSLKRKYLSKNKSKKGNKFVCEISKKISLKLGISRKKMEIPPKDKKYALFFSYINASIEMLKSKYPRSFFEDM